MYGELLSDLCVHESGPAQSGAEYWIDGLGLLAWSDPPGCSCLKLDPNPIGSYPPGRVDPPWSFKHTFGSRCACRRLGLSQHQALRVPSGSRRVAYNNMVENREKWILGQRRLSRNEVGAGHPAVFGYGETLCRGPLQRERRTRGLQGWIIASLPDPGPHSFTVSPLLGYCVRGSLE